MTTTLIKTEVRSKTCLHCGGKLARDSVANGNVICGPCLYGRRKVTDTIGDTWRRIEYALTTAPLNNVKRGQLNAQYLHECLWALRFKEVDEYHGNTDDIALDTYLSSGVVKHSLNMLKRDGYIKFIRAKNRTKEIGSRSYTVWKVSPPVYGLEIEERVEALETYYGRKLLDVRCRPTR